MSVLPSFAVKWLVPRMSRFQDRHPDIDLRITAADRLVDFAVNGSISFARFSLDGNRLFLFSDAQVAYAIDLTKIKVRPKTVIF